jgi:hypothetical protein
VYDPGAFTLPRAKKSRGRFRQGKTDRFDDPKSERPLTIDLSGAIGFMLKEKPFSSCEVLCHHMRIAKATSLRIRHDKLGSKIPSLMGSATPIDHPEGRKNVMFEATSDGTDDT